jgi:glycosyltransferase involved in cell wall biosynthesis
VQKILFLRKFKKASGGQIKVRDYFMHCLHHPGLDPYLFLKPDSDNKADEVWNDIPKDRIVSNVQVEKYDMVFIGGGDWRRFPEAIDGKKKIINLIQHVKHGNKKGRLFQYLERSAFRICVSQEVAEAIAPYANGEIVVINNGIPLDIFTKNAEKVENSILIWARKNPKLGKKLHEKLGIQNEHVSLLLDNVPREEFARRLGKTDIFVPLPNETEGFYLPAIEGMASGCVVVCSDAIGNRSFCKHGETCLMPGFDDFDGHVRMVSLLLAEPSYKERIRRRGGEIAQTFSLASERKAFYKFLSKFTGMQAALA